MAIKDDNLGFRLTRGEYWILESAVEARPWFAWLGRPDIAECFNKPGHGMNFSQVVETICGLVKEKFICAYSREAGEFFPDERQVVQLLQKHEEKMPGSPWHYALTPAGGAVWEEFAAPDWDFYIDQLYGTDDHVDTIELACARRDWLEAFVGKLTEAGYGVSRDTLTWETLTPWQATYWKQLPCGYRASGIHRPANRPADDLPPGLARQMQNGYWYQWK